MSATIYWPATTSVVAAQARATKTSKCRRRRRRGKHRVENQKSEEILPVQSFHPNDAHHPLCADGDVSIGEDILLGRMAVMTMPWL